LSALTLQMERGRDDDPGFFAQLSRGAKSCVHVFRKAILRCNVNKPFLVLPVLLSLAACTTSTVTTGFYDIKGNDEKSLDRSVRKLGPQNGHAFASTELRLVPLDIHPSTDARGCRVGTAKIKVVANITLPRWQDRSGATGDLKRGFDNYAAYAKLHEQQHVKIGEAAAGALEASLLAIPPQKNCDITLRKSKFAIRSVLARHHRAQLAFDALEKRRINALIRAAQRK
jgi:predicted secreted Zn-dependent protease